MPGARDGDREPADDARRPLDLLAMHRLARRADGGAALLEWLGRRAGGWAGLVDRSGAPLVSAEPAPVDAEVLAGGLAEMHERGLAAFVVDAGRRRVALLAVGAQENPFLAVVGPGDAPATLLSDAAVLLATPWEAQLARRSAASVELAEARCREAVLHLLMGRHLATARQLAAALSPALPETTRVHVIETGPERRGEVIHRCRQLTGDDAWIVRCPVYARHVIVLAPAGAAERSARPLDRAIAAEVGDCTVGAGEAVGLRDTSVGYEQAFHALAVARGRAERWARFDATLDLATVVGPTGRAWADTVLSPLAGYVAVRTTDPDADELMTTARSWLSFSTAASRHLKVHRNTLGMRLKRIEDLLALDLARPDQQAALDLALRIHSGPRPVDPDDATDPRRTPGPDDLLRLPAAQHWADAALRPVRRAANAPALEATLRAWLRSGGRLSETADALDLSIAGARKRMERLEQILERSLLHAPSARHDLWWAVRATDLGRAGRGLG